MVSEIWRKFEFEINIAVVDKFRAISSYTPTFITLNQNEKLNWTEFNPIPDASPIIWYQVIKINASN